MGECLKWIIMGPRALLNSYTQFWSLNISNNTSSTSVCSTVNLIIQNIVKMLGVYYLSEGDVLPVLVMELMEYKLTTLLEMSQDIPVYVKLSILQDVSRGVHYLHTLNCPVIHRDLSSNDILLNNNMFVLY